jgi:hypothetical protein
MQSLKPRNVLGMSAYAYREGRFVSSGRSGGRRAGSGRHLAAVKDPAPLAAPVPPARRMAPTGGACFRRKGNKYHEMQGRPPPMGPPFGNLFVAGQSALATRPNNGSCETSISRNNQSTSQVHPASDIAPMQSAFPPNALSIPAATPSTIFMACSDIVRSFEQQGNVVKTQDTPTHP